MTPKRDSVGGDSQNSIPGVTDCVKSGQIHHVFGQVTKIGCKENMALQYLETCTFSDKGLPGGSGKTTKTSTNGILAVSDKPNANFLGEFRGPGRKLLELTQKEITTIRKSAYAPGEKLEHQDSLFLAGQIPEKFLPIEAPGLPIPNPISPKSPIPQTLTTKNPKFDIKSPEDYFMRPTDTLATVFRIQTQTDPQGYLVIKTPDKLQTRKPHNPLTLASHARPKITIGRSLTNDLPFNDPWDDLSNHHLSIQKVARRLLTAEKTSIFLLQSLLAKKLNESTVYMLLSRVTQFLECEKIL